MASHMPGRGKHSCHTWVDRWASYTEWREAKGVTASAIHQAAVNFLLDSEPDESTTPEMLLHEAKIIQANRVMKRGGEE